MIDKPPVLSCELCEFEDGLKSGRKLNEEMKLIREIFLCKPISEWTW